MSCQRWKIRKEKNNRNNPQNEPNIVKRLSRMRPIIEIYRKWLSYDRVEIREGTPYRSPG